MDNEFIEDKTISYLNIPSCCISRDIDFMIVAWAKMHIFIEWVNEFPGYADFRDLFGWIHMLVNYSYSILKHQYSNCKVTYSCDNLLFLRTKHFIISVSFVFDYKNWFIFLKRWITGMNICSQGTSNPDLLLSE